MNKYLLFIAQMIFCIYGSSQDNSKIILFDKEGLKMLNKDFTLERLYKIDLPYYTLTKNPCYFFNSGAIDYSKDLSQIFFSFWDGIETTEFLDEMPKEDDYWTKIVQYFPDNKSFKEFVKLPSVGPSGNFIWKYFEEINSIVYYNWLDGTFVSLDVNTLERKRIFTIPDNAYFLDCLFKADDNSFELYYTQGGSNPQNDTLHIIKYDFNIIKRDSVFLGSDYELSSINDNGEIFCFAYVGSKSVPIKLIKKQNTISKDLPRSNFMTYWFKNYVYIIEKDRISKYNNNLNKVDEILLNKPWIATQLDKGFIVLENRDKVYYLNFELEIIKELNIELKYVKLLKNHTP